MIKKVKIGLVVFSLAGGGLERTVLNILLKRAKHVEIDLITYRSNVDYKNLLKKTHKKYIPILKDTSRIPRIFLPFKLLYFFIRFFNILKKNKYDYLIGIDYLTYFPTYVGAKIWNIPYILTFHIPISYIFNSPDLYILKYLKFIYKKIINQSHSIICVSKGVAYDLSQFIGKNIRTKIIYNGVLLNDRKTIKLEKTPQKKQLFKLKRKNKIIITCGRLVEQKGHSYLITTFKILKEKNSNIKLIILGSGPLKKQLTEHIRSLDLENDIFIIDFVENPYPYFKLADLFVLSSLFEGFANVIVEAMACGVPVISTDCRYGPREIIDSKETKYPVKPINKAVFYKYGVLTPNFRKNSSQPQLILANSINNMLKNSSLLNKYKEAGLKRAKEFNIKITQNKYIKYLEKLDI